ncbi:MAG TPA: RDD family protein [Anaerolineae bacterium]|nr:RDD family protein [Anaerolineae bacterium]
MTESSEQLTAESRSAGRSTPVPAPAEASETPPETDPPAAIDSDSHEPEGAAVEQDVVDGMATPVPDTGAGQTAGSGDKLARVTLGSALLVIDTVNERLDRLNDAEVEPGARRRSESDVLVPMSDWEQRFGISVDRPARHLALGIMIDARSKAGAAVRFLNDIGNGLAGTINFLLRPVRNRRAFRPVQRGFGKAVDRGDSQVERWRAMGRAEDSRSRAMAETALNNAAEETMDELIANEQVEIFIQEVIASQTVGIVDEIIEEIRERAVSSDDFFEGPIHRIFRRPDRSELPGPDFDPRLVRSIVRRNQPIPEGSRLGYYAGFVSRLLALVLDVGLVILVLALGSSLLTTAIDVLGLREWFDTTVGSTGLFTSLFAVVNGMAIVVSYLVLFWLLTGQTLGMMLMGLRVVSRGGGRVTLWRAILRIIGFLLFASIFLIGFLWVLGDDKRQALHDKLAGTYVVYAWDARPDETFLTYSMYIDN